MSAIMAIGSSLNLVSTLINVFIRFGTWSNWLFKEMPKNKAVQSTQIMLFFGWNTRVEVCTTLCCRCDQAVLWEHDLRIFSLLCF